VDDFAAVVTLSAWSAATGTSFVMKKQAGEFEIVNVTALNIPVSLTHQITPSGSTSPSSTFRADIGTPLPEPATLGLLGAGLLGLAAAARRRRERASASQRSGLRLRGGGAARRRPFHVSRPHPKAPTSWVIAAEASRTRVNSARIGPKTSACSVS
jgi:hypothetical protein